MQYSKSLEKTKSNMVTLKKFRTLEGLSQKEFAEKYKIKLNTLQKWEQGQNFCPDYVIAFLKIIHQKK